MMKVETKSNNKVTNDTGDQANELTRFVNFRRLNETWNEMREREERIKALLKCKLTAANIQR